MTAIKAGTAQRLGIRRPPWTLDRLGDRASDLDWALIGRVIREGGQIINTEPLLTWALTATPTKPVKRPWWKRWLRR